MTDIPTPGLTNGGVDEPKKNHRANSANVVLRKLRESLAQDLVQAMTHTSKLRWESEDQEIANIRRGRGSVGPMRVYKGTS